MLPWLSQSSGSGIGNGIRSHTSIYCSMIVLSCTLFFTRLYNQAHIHFDPRLDLTSLLQPISSSKFSLQHSLPQRRLVMRAASKAAAVAIPALSTTIQAAPAIIPDVPLDVNLSTRSSSPSSSSASTSSSTSSKKSTKSTHIASPTPSPNESPSSESPSPQATGAPGLNDSPPSTENAHAPSQARVGAGASPSDASSSHYNPLATASGLFGDSTSGPGPQNGILPNNDPNKSSPSTGKNNMSPTTMLTASLGSIAAVVVLVVGALVVRRRARNRRRSQEELDFEGMGAYPSGATAGGGGGGGGGKGKKRQQKTEYHVGLTSFGSIVSSVGGGRMATTGIKKPVPLAQREQFWNP